jgi:hypothetical protein
MPRLPQAYSLTSVGTWIVPVVTKARKQYWGMSCGFENCDLCCVAKTCPEWAKSDAGCQVVFCEICA